MSEVKWKTDCSYCGGKETVNVITKETKYSRTVKVLRCTSCKRQEGVKTVLTKD